MTFLRNAFFVFMTLTLISCQTTQPTLNTTVGAIEIESVQVARAGDIPPGSDVVARVQTYVQYRLSKQSAANGVPVKVLVTITRLHRKNPGLSLLVGDANYVNSSVTITGLDGKPLMQREISAIYGGAVNGVIGAVAAAASNETETDDKLADTLAENIERAIFGRALVGRLELPPTPTPIASSDFDPAQVQ
jgi:hypothetical protein